MKLQGNYGLLLNEKDIKLQRNYFKEMCNLIGANVVYRSPKKDKHWTTYSEIKSNYNSPILVGCIFNEFPDQRTMKKLGWVSELDKDASIISVPYDTPNIQVGALFEMPGALDGADSRLFRVTKLSTIMIYPASVTCEMIPEFKDNFNPDLHTHKHTDFNLLKEED